MDCSKSISVTLFSLPSLDYLAIWGSLQFAYQSCLVEISLANDVVCGTLQFHFLVVHIYEIYWNNLTAGNASLLPPLVPDQIIKLKQLTVLSLAETNKVCYYFFDQALFYHTYIVWASLFIVLKYKSVYGFTWVIIQHIKQPNR